MMFLLGNIGAPPTVTGFCAKAVLEIIVTSANKLNAKNFSLLSLFLSFVIQNELLPPRALLFNFHQMYGHTEWFGLVVTVGFLLITDLLRVSNFSVHFIE